MPKKLYRIPTGNTFNFKPTKKRLHILNHLLGARVSNMIRFGQKIICRLFEKIIGAFYSIRPLAETLKKNVAFGHWPKRLKKCTIRLVVGFRKNVFFSGKKPSFKFFRFGQWPKRMYKL
jgi:hypothetical protein